MPRSASRVYGVLAALVLIASPALAQFRPRPISNPANGERFHIEGAAGFWNPSATMSISSESLGIPGTTIDFKKDLGLTDQRFGELHGVLRASRKHKFRFQYIPIKDEQRAIYHAGHRVQRTALPRRLPCQFRALLEGVPLRVGIRLPRQGPRFRWVHPRLQIHRRPSVAINPRSRYTRIRQRERADSHAGRHRASDVVPMVSITGELTGIKIPDSISEDFRTHYADLDIYGTVNFTNNIGAQLGFRSFDVGYRVDQDTGSFTLKGLYFGVVARY